MTQTPTSEIGAMATLDSSFFDDVLLGKLPLIDVRAPIEFDEGHVPNSINIPLLDNAQREQVGRRYKQQGQEAAIALGQTLVAGQDKAEKLKAWCNTLASQPHSVITCFRGGLRSKTTQAWLQENGWQVARIEGGYKALRHHAIATTARVSQNKKLIIVGGRTGIGKTHLVNRLNSSVDLEGLANHRGSAFGRRATPQPAQAVFENQLASALLTKESLACDSLFLEDESRAIGSISLPLEFHRAMSLAPIVSVEEPLEYRVETILNDYIVSNLQDFRNLTPENADSLFADSLLGSLDRIQKRLGGERHLQVGKLMQTALANDNDHDLHRQWIRSLLCDYYDPMYSYQMEKKKHRLVFRGNSRSFLDWAAEFDAAQS